MDSTLWEVWDANKGYYDDLCRKNGVEPTEALTEEEILELRQWMAESEA